MMSKKPTFNLLRLAMKQRNHTVAWVARRSKLTDHAIHNLANGAEPKLSTIISISKALGVNAQDIWPDLQDVV